LGGIVYGLLKAIDIHIVIAQTVHFCKFHAHFLSVWLYYSRKGHKMQRIHFYKLKKGDFFYILLVFINKRTKKRFKI
jgi:hypothetical protein